MYKLLIGILCFILGATIYLLFRDRHLLVFHLIDSIGLHSQLETVRIEIGKSISPSKWMLYSLPDGSWCMAYILIMDYVADKEKQKKRLILLSIIPLIGFISEILQFFGIVQGTFDIIDLAFYIIPIIIYISVCKITRT